MPIDWFRRTDWTPRIEAEFFARLRRARPGNRPQYLAVQAGELAKAGGERRLRKALELLDLVVAHYPTYFDLTTIYWIRGQCLAGLGKVDEALDALRKALGVQRDRPNVRTDAYLEFGILVVNHLRRDLYAQALAALDEFGGRELFPYQQYEAAAIRAAILDARGDADTARAYALRALDAASKTTSGLRYHARLGLVKDSTTSLHGRLKRIAHTRQCPSRDWSRHHWQLERCPRSRANLNTPHPSGASRWLNDPTHRDLLRKGLAHVRRAARALDRHASGPTMRVPRRKAAALPFTIALPKFADGRR